MAIEREILLETPVGQARATVTPARSSRGLVALGHGAGGGITAPDLLAVTGALVGAGWTVARVEQPYRVLGRRAPDRAPRLDAAWVSAVGQLRRRYRAGPLVVGGRSSGARVACRTAEEAGAVAVICLAFPLHPPARPESSRASELVAATQARPVLVVQGESDPFGGRAEFPAGPTVVAVPGDHSLRRTAPVAAAVVEWLAQAVA